MCNECASKVIVMVRVYVCLSASMTAYALSDVFPTGRDVPSSNARAPYIPAETGLAEEAADRVGAIAGSNDGEVVLRRIVLLMNTMHII